MSKRIGLSIIYVVMSGTAAAVSLATDPTRPLVSSNVNAPSKQVVANKDLVLQAIQSNPSGKYAVINGTLVTVGDEIDNRTKILAIGDNEVVVRRMGTEHRLRLLNYSVRQEKNNKP